MPADELDRSVWVCSAQHPIDPEGDHGLLSYAQLEYAHAWLSERSVPCLGQLGYRPGAVPPWERFAQPDQGIANWSPYWNVEARADEFKAVIAACPPPPVGSNWAPYFGQ